MNTRTPHPDPQTYTGDAILQNVPQYSYQQSKEGSTMLVMMKGKLLEILYENVHSQINW